MMEQTSVEWIYIRPARAGLARSIIEVRREWSLVDLWEAHQTLDVEADIEEFAAREHRRQQARR